jgi:hypothetical protein
MIPMSKGQMPPPFARKRDKKRIARKIPIKFLQYFASERS